jgi:hypothetical protein
MSSPLFEKTNRALKELVEVKKEHAQELVNKRGQEPVLYIIQPEDKLETPESQKQKGKELMDGLDEEYKKMKAELLKERIELGHHRLEFREAYFSSNYEQIYEYDGIIVILGYIVPIICTFNHATEKFSVVVDKHNLERINNEYKFKNELF